jgi:hypothetical protein
MLGGSRSSKRPQRGAGLAVTTDLAAAAACVAAAVGEVGSPTAVRPATPTPPALTKVRSARLLVTDDGSHTATSITTSAGDAGDAAAPPLQRKNSSKKFHSFRQHLDEQDEAHELPSLIRSEPPTLANLGRPVRSRDVGKTTSIPNLKNMGIRPVRTSISTQKDSAQHLLYLRIATPFDPPNERPYSILKVGQDYEAEVKRVRAQRQDPQYKYVSFYALFGSDRYFHTAYIPSSFQLRSTLRLAPNFSVFPSFC